MPLFKKKKWIFSILFVPIFCFAVFSFYWSDSWQKKTKKTGQAKCTFQYHLKEVYPVTCDKNIVAIVFSEENKPICERTLDSIIKQIYLPFRVIYIDNGSTEESFAQAVQYVKKKEIEERITLFHVKKRKPKFEALYEVIHNCSSSDIVVLIDSGDWLAHEYVFDHLNRAYANSDVWATYSRSISHPDYQNIQGSMYRDTAFSEKEFRRHRAMHLTGLKSFYAGFFQTIRLQDAIFQGSFIDDMTIEAIFFPLLEMGPEHILFVEEISYVESRVKNRNASSFHLRKKYAEEDYLRSLPKYSTITHWYTSFEEKNRHPYKADVLIFSKDRPLQLYALIESLFQYVSNLGAIQVIYEGSDAFFERAYLQLKAEFPSIRFLVICEHPEHEFTSLVKQALADSQSSSPYVLLLDDRVRVTEKIKLHDCIQALESTHTDHFILTEEEYAEKEQGYHFSFLTEAMIAHQVKNKEETLFNWRNLCRKKVLLTKMLDKVNSMDAFVYAWEERIPRDSVILFFEKAKLTSLEKSVIAKEEQVAYARRFIEGFKIDLPSLICEGNNADYPLIKRQYRRKVAHEYSP